MNFVGPLPPPHMLAEYERLIPEGADRLMRILEEQTRFRLEQDSEVSKTHLGLQSRGQIIGAVLCVIFGGMGWQLGNGGHDVFAGLLFSTTIIGMVTVFVIGRVPPRTSPEVSDSEK